MRRVSALSAAILLGLASSVGGLSRAAEPAKPAASTFDLLTIGLPMMVHGRLVNYVFVQVRMTLAKGVDASKLLDQEPFIRDAVVRAATHTPFNPPEDGVHLDDARFKAAVMKIAVAQLGPNQVVGVTLLNEMPQRRSGVPGGGIVMAAPSTRP